MLRSPILVTNHKVRIHLGGTLMFTFLVTLMSTTIGPQTSRVVVIKDVHPLKDKMTDRDQDVKILVLHLTISMIPIGAHTIRIRIEILPGIEVDMISFHTSAQN